jgi:hypothetical protein
VFFFSRSHLHKVGNVIKQRENLVVSTPQFFHDRFRIDVRLESTATAIDRNRKVVTYKTNAGAVTELEVGVVSSIYIFFNQINFHQFNTARNHCSTMSCYLQPVHRRLCRRFRVCSATACLHCALFQTPIDSSSSSTRIKPNAPVLSVESVFLFERLHMRVYDSLKQRSRWWLHRTGDC